MKASDVEKEDILKSLVSDLGKKRDPKFCKSVRYVVGKAVLKNVSGTAPTSIPYTFDQSIGEDTHLKDALKKQ
ncbi:hypothetical protein [Flavivirga jejuensis]|uniref:Uncharacterized protein n=1 Tax=Flavivirga jejuensis TaxID=870487 RepID=A0ABT8WNW3_9FLAO|nr:hypothetical protein [Flavivirga jejuensis]MDO5974848.1 hypothetical protein [Flavivirga jejuensis]